MKNQKLNPKELNTLKGGNGEKFTLTDETGAEKTTTVTIKRD